MNRTVKYQRLNYIPYSLFILISIILIFVDKDNLVPILVFTLITALPEIIKPLSKKNKQFHKIFEELKGIFYFSIFFFYFGYFFSLFFKSDSRVITSGLALGIVIIVYFIVLLSIFVYWSFSTHSIANEYGKEILKRDTIPLRELLKIAKEKNANILAVAGNLKALGDKRGLSLLTDFLNDNSENQVQLFIPKSSKDSLPNIKRKLNNNSFALRVKIFEIEPFVFLQGIVFAGKVDEYDSTHFRVKTKGYYLYKPILYKNDSFPSEGVFIDVSEIAKEDYFSIAIEAYYRHLRKSLTKVNGYKFKVEIRNGEGKIHQYVSEPYTLNDV